MDSNKIDMFFATNSKKFKPIHVATLREKMQLIDDGKFTTIQCLELKDPSTMFLISLFLGGLGVDCFMMGKTGRGILKLLTWGVFGILWLVDLIKIKEQVQEKNYMEVMAVL